MTPTKYNLDDANYEILSLKICVPLESACYAPKLHLWEAVIPSLCMAR